jgi:hypothetical protein
MGMWTLVLKTFYILYFFQPTIIGKHGRKDIGGCWIGKRKFAFAAMKGTKKAFFENK